MNGVLGKAELKFTINDYLICTVSYISVILFILLGSLPNSHRQIETEIMRRLMLDNKISEIVNSGMQTKGLEILKNRESVGSLSETEFSSDDMHRFRLNYINIQESTITGSEPFLGEMLNPSSKNITLSSSMLDLMVEYYMATYESLEFRKPFGEGSLDAIIIRIKMNRFGRCRIGSEFFGSVISSRHEKSSYILAKFMTNSGIDCYPGQIQYFFTHTVDLPGGASEHYLAYVRWYRHADSAKMRYYFSIDDDNKTCNVELWRNDFYPESRDCIIPVHNILCRFVPVKYKTSNRRTAVQYLAINPIGRKYHIR
jgi:hypothetical protein